MNKKTLNDYMEMARQSDRSQTAISSYWAANSHQVIDCVKDLGPELCLDIIGYAPESDEADAFMDSTAKHQALEMLNVMGVAEVDAMVQDWLSDLE
jgi:hypothetical protein